MLEIWGRRTSSNVQALMWCIGELELPYKRQDIGHRYGGNDTPEFLAMNPNGTVPVLRDGTSDPLWETGAILRYLADRYGTEPFWPKDSMARAKIDKWAEWSKINIAMAFAKPIFWRVVRTAPSQHDASATAKAIAYLDQFLDIAETQLSQVQFIAGDTFTLADIHFGHSLFRYFNIEIARKDRPNLRRYYEQLKSRPAFREHVMVDYMRQSTHQVIVFTRGQPKSDPLLEKTSQVQVIYDDVTSLTQTLEQYGVHTVISAIGILSDETAESQLNLIEAADRSLVTKRFMPSEYSFVQTKNLLPIDPSIKYWLEAADLLAKTKLQYTRVIPGFFMDYWGMPVVRTNLQPFTFGIDIASCQAAIPGDGNDVLCMTYTYDMAAFMVRLLDEEKWPEFSVIVGDQITYNQLLQLAEQIRGRKFQVTYDNAEQIKEGNVTVPPMPAETGYSVEELKETTALVSRLTIARVFDLPVDNRLNARFPDIETMKIKDFLHNAWKDYS
ncbi:hypothetical protein BBP40_009759 [Aspergillus hancockii]|nr:hypothetical protein BBP40_009759 [Aspergillus hancockii]